MTDATAQAIYFYDRHPMSGEIIKAKLRAARGHLKDVKPEELWPHDQDHYGGIAATDALAQAASIAPARSSPISVPASAAPCATSPIATAPTSPASN